MAPSLCNVRRAERGGWSEVSCQSFSDLFSGLFFLPLLGEPFEWPWVLFEANPSRTPGRPTWRRHVPFSFRSSTHRSLRMELTMGHRNFGAGALRFALTWAHAMLHTHNVHAGNTLWLFEFDREGHGPTESKRTSGGHALLRLMRGRKVRHGRSSKKTALDGVLAMADRASTEGAPPNHRVRSLCQVSMLAWEGISMSGRREAQKWIFGLQAKSIITLWGLWHYFLFSWDLGCYPSCHLLAIHPATCLQYLLRLTEEPKASQEQLAKHRGLNNAKPKRRVFWTQRTWTRPWPRGKLLVD